MKKLGFGLMQLPLLDKDDYNSVDMKCFEKMADTFMANGFTYFDTASRSHSGYSEIAFREAVVRRYPRFAYTITDNLPLFMIQDEREMLTFFENQLERLGTDYIDYYWIHGLNGQTLKKAENIQVYDFVMKKKSEGKIHHIGVCFNDKAVLLDEILTAHPELEYVQIQLNYFDWNSEAESRLCYEIAVKHNKPVIVINPEKGGILNNIPKSAKMLLKEKYHEFPVSSWAIRFAASPSHVMMVLSDMNNEQQVEENIKYMKDFQPIDENEWQVVEQVVRIIMEGNKGGKLNEYDYFK